MSNTQKYICLLPTGGHLVGDIVEMTEEEFAGQNANEPEPRFALHVEDEGTSTETANEEASAEEGEEQSGEAGSETDLAETTEGDKAPEETTTTDEGASSTEEAAATTEGESTEEATA